MWAYPLVPEPLDKFTVYGSFYIGTYCRLVSWTMQMCQGGEEHLVTIERCLCANGMKLLPNQSPRCVRSYGSNSMCSLCHCLFTRTMVYTGCIGIQYTYTASTHILQSDWSCQHSGSANGNLLIVTLLPLEVSGPGD